jgi:hypothetical protein
VPAFFRIGDYRNFVLFRTEENIFGAIFGTYAATSAGFGIDNGWHNVFGSSLSLLRSLHA